MDREIRLWQLTRALLSGEMTEQERREYDELEAEQAAALKDAMLKLATERVLRKV